MLNSRTLMLFFMAVILAVGAVLIAQRWVESMGNSDIQQVQYSKVIVAAMDIPQWKKVGESDVTEKSWPKDTVTKDMFTEKSQVVGKVAINNVFTDEPLNTRRVVDPKGGNIFSLGFPENKRAFTVRVNDVSGVGGFLLPDNHVDVLASRKLSGMSEEVRTETVVQDIKVLAVDQESSNDGDKNKPIVVRSVTLEMTPQQAEDVFKAQEQGSIQLALRNPTDRTLLEKPEIVASVAMPPMPRAAAPRGKTFTVIRGMNQSKVQCKGYVCSEQQI